ncbi:hypothetical protein P8936_06870 [Edaphobacter paludis]|uniref:Uncharacterized protein n=1 Tax=Edaphobacter paludis TaxID=3035702 RepID=A0AAU7DB68_9BACT
MSIWKMFALSALGAALLVGTPATPAQVSINIGVAPICPYGYFDFPPYDCAPYGYYGPDWFVGGVFIGAGPWFHGPRGFYGHVDNRFDPRHGYRGPLPERGAQPFQHFQGNEARDGRGHVGTANHDARNEHSAGYRGAGHPGGRGRDGGHR